MKIGNDIVEVQRFADLVNNKRFIARVYTEQEWEHIQSAKNKQKIIERMAGKFSAKEAISKALGLGISEGVTLNSIEILPNDKGEPRVNLTGEAKNLLDSLGFKQVQVSISNSTTFATAVCIIF